MAIFSFLIVLHTKQLIVGLTPLYEPVRRYTHTHAYSKADEWQTIIFCLECDVQSMERLHS